MEQRGRSRMFTDAFFKRFLSELDDYKRRHPEGQIQMIPRESLLHNSDRFLLFTNFGRNQSNVLFGRGTLNIKDQLHSMGCRFNRFLKTNRTNHANNIGYEVPSNKLEELRKLVLSTGKKLVELPLSEFEEKGLPSTEDDAPVVEDELVEEVAVETEEKKVASKKSTKKSSPKVVPSSKTTKRKTATRKKKQVSEDEEEENSEESD